MAQSSRAFVARLASIGRSTALEFFTGSYSEALRQGSRESRPVLLYLHSDLHEDSDDFVKDVLFAAEVQSLIRANNMIVWAGSVHYLDGFEASSRFGVSAYPFATVCVPASTTRTGQQQYAKLWSCGGLPPLQEFVSSLRASVGRFTTQVEVARAEESAVLQERELAQEQDR